MHGVVDSEDIPLNISRETMQVRRLRQTVAWVHACMHECYAACCPQDSALIKRLASVLTRRVLRFFEGEARRDAERYNAKFFQEFGQFLKARGSAMVFKLLY